MTTIELAKALLSLDWAAIQADEAGECDTYLFLRAELLKLNKVQIIQLMLHVMEANSLNLLYGSDKGSLFEDLKEFNHLNEYLFEHEYVPNDNEEEIKLGLVKKRIFHFDRPKEVF